MFSVVNRKIRRFSILRPEEIASVVSESSKSNEAEEQSNPPLSVMWRGKRKKSPNQHGTRSLLDIFPVRATINADMIVAVQTSKLKSKDDGDGMRKKMTTRSMSTASTAFAAANATITEESSEDDDDDDLLNYTLHILSTATRSKSDEAEEVASMISGSAKSDEAKEIASVISGSAKSDEAEEEGIAFLVIEEFALDEESKTPPPDPSRLEAYRKQIVLLGLMRKISDKNTTTLDKTCPLPSLICKVAKWFIRLYEYWKKALQNKNPPQPFVIFDIENARERYPGKSNEGWRPYPRRTYTRSISLPFVLRNTLVLEA